MISYEAARVISYEVPWWGIQILKCLEPLYEEIWYEGPWWEIQSLECLEPLYEEIWYVVPQLKA